MRYVGFNYVFENGGVANWRTIPLQSGISHALGLRNSNMNGLVVHAHLNASEGYSTDQNPGGAYVRIEMQSDNSKGDEAFPKTLQTFLTRVHRKPVGAEGDTDLVEIVNSYVEGLEKKEPTKVAIVS